MDFTAPAGSTTNPTPGSVPASLPAVMAGSSFAVDETKACSVIESAKLLSSSSFTSPDKNQTTIGGLDFTLDCTSLGGDAAVSFTLGATIPDLSKAKVYKQTTDGVTTDITSQVTLTNESTPQGTRTVISYNLTDGGSLDDDKTVNSSITDPIYITVPSATAKTLLGVPSTGVQMMAQDGTRSNWLYAILASVFAISLAVSGVIVIKRQS